MKMLAGLAALGLLTLLAVPADASERHRVKHGSHAPSVSRQASPRDGEYRGYRYGGPLYTTCDRINADRMLVGTCR
jgi:hypothetical protein